jgi:hypothetical protein
MKKHRWYKNEQSEKAHIIEKVPESWLTSPYDVYAILCSGKHVCYVDQSLSKFGWRFLGNEVDPGIRCAKCEKKLLARQERQRRWAEQSKKREARLREAKKKRAARKREKCARQHAKLVKDIRDLIDSKKRSSNKLVEQIIRMVKNGPPKS